MEPRFRSHTRSLAIASLAATLTLGACSSDPAPREVPSEPTAAPTAAATPAVPDETETNTEVDTGADEREEALFPDVLDAVLRPNGDTWTASVTLSSPYDTPERYADAWRVLDESGTELGVRVLTHDHQNEQPFTRSLNNLVIPDGVRQVTIEGRDQISGWGGATVTIAVPLP